MGRKYRKNSEVDVSRFDPLVEEANRAFGTIYLYAVRMMERAAISERKRLAAARRKEEGDGTGGKKEKQDRS